MATWGPKKIQRFTATLIPLAEVSELALASYKRHCRNGTTPGNPKWYRPQVIKPFVPQLSRKLYAIETGQEFQAAHCTKREDPFLKARGFDGLEYVRAYELAAGLKITTTATVAAAAPQRQRRAA